MCMMSFIEPDFREYFLTLFVAQNGCYAKNWLGVSGSQWDTFLGPRVIFSHNAMQVVSFNTIVVSAWNLMYKWTFYPLEVS